MIACCRSALIALSAAALSLFVGGQPALAQTAPRQAPAAAFKPPYLTLAQLRKMYADPQSRYAVIGGLSIHYKDEGPRGAPVLLMVHGSESSLKTWDRETVLLKGRYRIVRMDMPGYGLSQGTTDAAAKAMVPTDLPIGLLDHLGIRKVTFVGVSSGGTMGMYLAARRPDMVERLILSNTPSDPVDTSHLVMPGEFIAAQDRAKATGFRDADFWDRFLAYFAGDASREEPDRADRQDRRRQAGHGRDGQGHHADLPYLGHGRSVAAGIGDEGDQPLSCQCPDQPGDDARCRPLSAAGSAGPLCPADRRLCRGRGSGGRVEAVEHLL
jgi:pimeloyl-ACP methyl ester carboxylesterase